MTEVFNTGVSEFKFSRGFQLPDERQFEDKRLDIVSWGKKNLFPNFLNNLFYSSAYHGGIIRSKVSYIVGSGFKGEVNEDAFGDYSAQDVLNSITLDEQLYGAFAIRVKRSLDGTRSYEHIDFDMLRADLYGRGWWYSDDWSLGTALQSEEKTSLKLLWNYDDDNEDQYDSIYVAYFENPKNRQTRTSKKDQVNVYPQPGYISALKSIMTDIEIQSFHLYNIINGMKVSGALNFANGEPENKKQFEDAVKDAITPSENSGGVMITYSDGDDRKLAWVPFTGDDLDKRYLMLEESTVQNILSGHSATSPILFGIKTKGQLGGTTEMESAFNIFVKTYARNKQKFIEEHFNYITKSNIVLNEPTNPLAVEETPQQEVIQQKFSDQETEDKILLSLMKCGKDKKDYRIIKSQSINDEFDFEKEEKTIKESFLRSDFAITDIESKVLSLINKGETLDSVLEALNEDKKEIQKAYSGLTERGLLENGQPTEQGIRELAQNQPDFELEILYSYELRPDAPPLKTESRDFCRILMASGRLYTRQEIEMISLDVDRNVWRYRGGWYNDPTKERPTPFCRHVWQQNLTTRIR